jgi:hypothetical protein
MRNLNDPTHDLVRYPRDGSAADRARRESQRECAMMPAPEPTATQLSHRWGVPLPIVQRLLELEARVKLLESK